MVEYNKSYFYLHIPLLVYTFRGWTFTNFCVMAQLTWNYARVCLWNNKNLYQHATLLPLWNAKFCPPPRKWLTFYQTPNGKNFTCKGLNQPFSYIKFYSVISKMGLKIPNVFKRNLNKRCFKVIYFRQSKLNTMQADIIAEM